MSSPSELLGGGRSPKKTTPQCPCPLCKSAMCAELSVFAGLYNSGYVKVNVKFSCTNMDCRYEERTKGESGEEETISKMVSLAASFRGPEMFKRGRFKSGTVGVNRRRHVGIGKFVAVDPPKE